MTLIFSLLYITTIFELIYLIYTYKKDRDNWKKMAIYWKKEAERERLEERYAQVKMDGRIETIRLINNDL